MNIQQQLVQAARRRTQMLDLANQYGKELLKEALEEKESPKDCYTKYNDDLEKGDE